MTATTALMAPREVTEVSHRGGPSGPFEEGLVRELKLGEQLYRYLTDLIESGKLAAGAKLPTEKELCERFRISRPVVREALARLRMEGVITSRRGSGSYIIGSESRSPEPLRAEQPSIISTRQSGPKLTNLLRCIEMRLMIECDAAYYAALRRTPEQLDAMAAAIAEMDEALAQRSLDHAAHFRFHLLVAEATDNQFVVSALRLLEHHMQVCMNLFRDLWLLEPGEPISAGEYSHQSIYDAIRDGRADAASRAMRLHIDEARREIFGDGPAATAPQG
jgi:GntR family transcriptional regulator, transcriptional repressor for pyruvate dehydrogenase complex